MPVRTPDGTSSARRGRLPVAARSERRAAVLDAALVELIESGYEQLTMLSVARRVGASKETLYAWFGSREGLITELIERNADESAGRVSEALERDADHVEVLTAYATGLLHLLCGPSSIALNRAAMTSPELAAALLQSGRHRIGPLVERYLQQLGNAGTIAIAHPGEAFQLLYGLVVQDTQIRVLLGESPPSTRRLKAQAAAAVGRFLTLVTPAPR